MTRTNLPDIYRAYIACLNAQDWPNLGRFVGDAVVHNARPLGLAGYREMLEQSFAAISDLRFDVELLVAEPPHIASRLRFDCTPTGTFLGLPVDGRRVNFCENVFYAFAQDKIVEVWSIIDRAAVEAQLAPPAR